MSKVKSEEVAKQTENAETTPETTDNPVSGALFPVPNEYELTQEAAVSAGSPYFMQHSGLQPAGDAQMETPGQQQTVVLSGGLTLEDLRAAMQHFTHERDWDKFHTPRNLLCALVGEVGELAEVFQWREEVERGLPDFSDDEKNHVAEELADVLLYLVRLSDVCGFDLGQAAINKLQINTQKYPAETVRGSAMKYNTYDSSSRSRRHKYDIPSARKDEEETGRKRARERFSEDQVAAMTELAEKAGWSITALTWEERAKFCQDYNVTKERLCNFFNNRKPKEMKRGRMAFMRRSSVPGYDAHYDGQHYQAPADADTHMQTEEGFLKRMNE